MLNAAIGHLVDDDAGILLPEKLAAMLHIPLAELARLTGIHRNTLAIRPDAPIVQTKIGMIARILAAAAELLHSEGKAVVWFRHQPLSGFDGRTAAELVTAGHAKAVIAHLEMLRDGVYA